MIEPRGSFKTNNNKYENIFLKSSHINILLCERANESSVRLEIKPFFVEVLRLLVNNGIHVLFACLPGNMAGILIYYYDVVQVCIVHQCTKPFENRHVSWMLRGIC